MTSERLQKILAKAGIASRRHAEQLIAEGAVTVNGVVTTVLGTRADPDKDFIKVKGKRILPVQHKVYLLLNKPKGCITSLSDPGGRRTVMDLIPDVKTRVCPVGRLDYDTEGLLLLTNDGDLAHALMHPKFQIEKTYWVKVRGHCTERDLKKVIRGGIPLPSGKTAPCRARLLRQTAQNDWLELILHEGKKREIRLMMTSLGHPVVKLKRVAYAFLKINTLATGRYRHLTAYEVNKFRSLVSRPGTPKPRIATARPSTARPSGAKPKGGRHRQANGDSGLAPTLKKMRRCDQP